VIYFCNDKSFLPFQDLTKTTSFHCTSLEIKGTSTLHSLCSTFISTADCLADVGLVMSEQLGLIVQEQDMVALPGNSC
jgi:hypothetical protein